MIEDPEFQNCEEAGRALGIDARTVGDWCHRGWIPGAIKTLGAGPGGRGRWRIPKASVEDAWRRMQELGGPS